MASERGLTRMTMNDDGITFEVGTPVIRGVYGPPGRTHNLHVRRREGRRR